MNFNIPRQDVQL